MKFIHKSHVFLVAGLLTLALLSSCGLNTAGGTTLSPTPTPKPKTPAALLQSSTTAMKQLKTLHIDSNITTTSDLGSSGTTTSKVKLVGDNVLPDQGSYQYTQDVTVGPTVRNTSFAEIIKDQKLYIQNKVGKWFVLDATTGDGTTKSIIASARDSGADSALKMTDNAQFTDHGVEKLNGLRLRHITAILDSKALTDKLTATLSSLTQSSGSSQSNTDLKSLLDNIKFDQITEEIWIDEATSYLHHTDLKYSLTLDLGTTKNSTTPSTIKSNNDTITDYSNFNKTVKIVPPADANPASNILEALR